MKSKSAKVVSRVERGVTVPFADRYTLSPQFKELFREGMALVEETAAYLDGQGRDESKALRSQVALAYSTESMRLTTRLMQLASWLLVRRAVSRGEMTLEQALRERSHARLTGITQRGERVKCFDELPEKLRELIAHCDALYDRVVRLDRLINASNCKRPAGNVDPLAKHLSRIEAAFAGRAVS